MHPEERANAVKCMLGDGTYGVGMGLAAVMTVLPLLFKALGAGAIEIGLLSSVTSAGWVLAQPVGLFVIGRRPRNKRFLLNWGVPFWVPTFLVMGAATYFLSGAHARLCRLILLMALAAWVCGDGMAVPLWNDWLSRLYGRDSRGRAMGMMAAAWAIGNGLAAQRANGLDDLAGRPRGAPPPVELRAEIVHDDLGPLPGELQRVGAADAAAGAGDDHDTSLADRTHAALVLCSYGRVPVCVPACARNGLAHVPRAIPRITRAAR